LGRLALAPAKGRRQTKFFINVSHSDLTQEKPGFPRRFIHSYVFFVSERSAACAAASRAMGTRKGEQET
jgi:hypothetical protein